MLKEVRFSIAALFCAAILSLVCGVASWSSARADSTSGKKDLASRQWAIVRVALPENDEPFPPGIGADIAGSQCLICHSAGMVLTQPPLKKDEWRAEIMKMRSAYGAPIPDDQVDALSEYLKNINGRQ
ncbi:MAG TPA: cytochrome c [Steroidobacteraceae bacterium]|jgi:mono/diheme cytochrome c family protein|nr:cytochrome c [Steroidobacteraceae bacterium]